METLLSSGFLRNLDKSTKVAWEHWGRGQMQEAHVHIQPQT